MLRRYVPVVPTRNSVPSTNAVLVETVELAPVPVNYIVHVISTLFRTLISALASQRKLALENLLTVERMKTVEEDLLKHSLELIERAHKAGKPFFLWHNSTRNHVWIHLNEKYAPG